MRNAGGGDVSVGGQGKVDDPAPLRPVPVVVYIPLRIQSPAYTDGGAGVVVIGELDPSGQRSGIYSDPGYPPNGANL